MHGRKRGEKDPIDQEKLEKYARLRLAALDMHKKSVFNTEGYVLTEKLLTINPDFYTLWNYRRNILKHFLGQKEIDVQQQKEFYVTECRVTETALKKNPKSYNAWFHRQWILDQGLIEVKQELDLCTRLLNADSRNFHCWNYRRYVVEKLKIPLEEEFKYTTEKIQEDFSNYSAWHYRSVLIPLFYTQALEKEGGNPEVKYDSIIDKEFEWVKTCFWMEPEDQSAWLYHRWLLGRVVASGPELPALGISLGTPVEIVQLSHAGASKFEEKQTFQRRRQRQIQVFERELAMCRELQSEMEEDSKWVLLTIAILIAGLEACHPSASEQYRQNIKSITEIFDKLVKLDGMRKRYYLDVQQSLLKQIEAASTISDNKESGGDVVKAEDAEKPKKVVAISSLSPLTLPPSSGPAWWWPEE